MKTKQLALINGIVGLVGGILLLLAPMFVLMTAASTLSSSATAGSATLFLLLGIAILILGIIGLVHYKGDTRVGTAPSVLLTVGGALTIIPFLGWIGGILSIIGGSLYLASLKKFETK